MASLNVMKQKKTIKNMGKTI